MVGRAPHNIPESGSSGGAEALIWQKFMRGGGWALLGKSSGVALSAIMTFLLARLVTPEELGVYFLVLSVVSIFSSIGLFGMQTSIVRLVSEAVGRAEPVRARSVVRKVQAVSILGALLMAAVLFFGGTEIMARSVFDSRLLGGMTFWVSLLTLGASLRQINSQIFRGFNNIRDSIIFGGLVANGAVVSLCTAALIFRVQVTLRLVFSALAVGMGLSVLGSASLIWRKSRELVGEGGPLAIRELLGVSFPLFVTTTMFLALKQFDLWLVGAFRPEEDVAIYGAALRLVLFVSLSLDITNTFLPPMIGELYARGEHDTLGRVIRTSSTLASIVSLAALLPMVLAPRLVLRLAFGAPFQELEAALILILLASGQFVGVLFGSCGQTLIMSGHERAMMKWTLLAGLSTFLAGLFLAPTIGAIGVAVASSLGLVVQNFLMWRSAKAKTGLSTNASPRMLPEVLNLARLSVRSLIPERAG